MNKPISMVVNETRISLLKICNESGLHACVLELIVKDLYTDVNRVSENQFKKDEESYIQAQKVAQNNENEPVTENK